MVVQKLPGHLMFRPSLMTKPEGSEMFSDAEQLPLESFADFAAPAIESGKSDGEPAAAQMLKPPAKVAARVDPFNGNKITLRDGFNIFAVEPARKAQGAAGEFTFFTRRAAVYFAQHLKRTMSSAEAIMLRDRVSSCDVLPLAKMRMGEANDENRWHVNVSVLTPLNEKEERDYTFSNVECAEKFARRCSEENAMTLGAVTAIADIFLGKAKAGMTWSANKEGFTATVRRRGFKSEVFSSFRDGTKEQFEEQVKAKGDVSSDDLATLAALYATPLSGDE
jgi:hypothetical protein